MKSCKHIIFDLDGTLVDSNLSTLKCWAYTINHYFPDYKYEDNDLLKTLGLTTKAGMEALGLPHSMDFEEQINEDYNLFVDDLCFFDGVEAMLNELKEKGYKLGVVSSRDRYEYTKYFEKFHFEKYFDVVILKDDTILHKPHKEPLLKYCEVASVRNEDCVYIGDMDTDIMCANSANVKAVLLAWDKEKVGKECLTVHSIEEIVNLFR